MQKWSPFLLKIVFSFLLINVLIHQVAASKKKKVIIKVPTHIKHVYHHHLKTIHIQQPKAPKQHHVHHEHFDDYHRDDHDDYKSKRQGKGYGSWRGLDSDSARYNRDYRSSSSSQLNSYSLSEEKPPPPPPNSGIKARPSINIHEEHYIQDGHGGWKPMGRNNGWREDSSYGFDKGSSPSPSYGRTKGVVYEQDSYSTNHNYDKPKPYEDVIDLTYNGNTHKNNYKDISITNKPLINNNYDSSEVEYKGSTTANFDNNYYSTSNKGYSEDSYNNHFGKKITYKPLQSKTRKNNKNVVNIDLTLPKTSPMNAWNEPTTVIPPIIPSIWPELKEHDSWHTSANNHNNNNNGGKLPAASSFVYNNHGGNSHFGVQESVAKPITAVTPFKSTIGNPVSSYQVQVMHYTDKKPS